MQPQRGKRYLFKIRRTISKQFHHLRHTCSKQQQQIKSNQINNTKKKDCTIKNKIFFNNINNITTFLRCGSKTRRIKNQKQNESKERLHDKGEKNNLQKKKKNNKIFQQKEKNVEPHKIKNPTEEEIQTNRLVKYNMCSISISTSTSNYKQWIKT